MAAQPSHLWSETTRIQQSVAAGDVCAERITPRVIPSQQAAGDIKKATDGDVETMNTFSGFGMHRRVMEKTAPFIKRAESLGPAQ